MIGRGQSFRVDFGSSADLEEADRIVPGGDVAAGAALWYVVVGSRSSATAGVLLCDCVGGNL